MTINVGINGTQKVLMNATKSVGAMKMTSVIGDENYFIIVKLTKIMDDNSNKLLIIKKTYILIKKDK